MISSTKTSHLDSIGSFLAMEIFSRAQQLEAQGREIIHLEFGDLFLHYFSFYGLTRKDGLI